MLFLLTGNGKGKTTCAVGMGIRATGSGKRVSMIQFLKTARSSEVKIIKGIEDFSIQSFGRNVCLSKDNITTEDHQLALTAFNLAKENLTQEKCDFLILDEINLALYFELLSQKQVIGFLEKWQDKVDIVLTGRYALQEIINMADLVTEFKEIKHYFQKGSKARQGIEF